MIRFGSVCSGIEAASRAWEPLGWKASFLSEIDAFPRSLLKQHYPDTPLHGDFTTIEAGQYEPIDVLAGGTPCQSFSVAGLRGGMADQRGNLALEYLRLAARLQPRWIVWENVPGVLSSAGGRDFGSFLGGLGQLGYGFAYRVLDAQYFGLAQRRKRVFVVGHLGDWRRAAAVLFEPASLRWHPAPSRKKGEGIAASLTRGADSGGKGGYAGRRREDDVNLVARPLTANRAGGSGGQRYDFETETFAIQERAVCENPNAGPDGAGWNGDGSAYTLEARASVQAVAFAQNSRDELRFCGGSGQVVGALAAQPGMKQQSFIVAPPLTGNPYGDHESREGLLVAGTLTGSGKAAGSATSQDASSGLLVSGTIMAAGSRSRGAGTDPGMITMAPEPVLSAVRSLTPRECERLQGFPDDYTLIQHNGKPAADGPRYRALGNSMAVPVMSWIGRRIANEDAR